MAVPRPVLTGSARARAVLLLLLVLAVGGCAAPTPYQTRRRRLRLCRAAAREQPLPRHLRRQFGHAARRRAELSAVSGGRGDRGEGPRLLHRGQSGPRALDRLSWHRLQRLRLAAPASVPSAFGLGFGNYTAYPIDSYTALRRHRHGRWREAGRATSTPMTPATCCASSARGSSVPPTRDDGAGASRRRDARLLLGGRDAARPRRLRVLADPLPQSRATASATASSSSRSNRYRVSFAGNSATSLDTGARTTRSTARPS